jgi:hypothetical protein
LTRRCFTKEDSKDIEQAVARTIVLRYSWRESLQYIKDQIGFSITEQGYYKIKKRLMGKGREWVQQMQQDQDSFLSEYRQRYEEMIQTQRDLQYIAIKDKDDNPLAAVKALMGYHQITNDLAALIDLLPYVAGGSSTKVGNNDRLPLAGDQQQSEKTSTRTEATTTRRTNNSVF